MPRLIQAAVCRSGGALPEIEQLILDDPLPGELVIKLEAAGICHTDVEVARWSKHDRVLGHEGAGTVVATGPGVTSFKPGDRVLATFGSCGVCPNCLGNRPAYCFSGIPLNIEGDAQRSRPSLSRLDGSQVGGRFFQQSSFATYALLTQRNAIPITNEIGMVAAAPLGCGIQTGAGAVFNQLGALPNRPLLVIGAGAVGLSAVMAGRILGCTPIVVIELSQQRRALALEVGGDIALDGADETWPSKVLADTGGGATSALDTAGSQRTFEAGLAALHPGGTLGVLTLPTAIGQRVSHPGGDSFLTKRIVGVVEGDSLPKELIPRLISLYGQGVLPIDLLIDVFPFRKIGEAFKAAKSGKCVKPVLTFQTEQG